MNTFKYNPNYRPEDVLKEVLTNSPSPDFLKHFWSRGGSGLVSMLMQQLEKDTSLKSEEKLLALEAAFKLVNLSWPHGEVKDSHEVEGKYYPYIPYNHSGFLGFMLHFKKLYPQFTNFIDVGSGLGDKVFIAKYVLGFNAQGIEYNTHTYYLSRFFESALNRHDYCEYTYKGMFINGDAFDYTDYNNKLVYMYVPIRDHQRMCKLYEHILNNMTDGILFDICIGSLTDFCYDNYKTRFGECYIEKKAGKVICRSARSLYREDKE